MGRKSKKVKPNRALMYKANDLIREFADNYHLTHCSFNTGYKMLINGQNVLYLYTSKLEYRKEGVKENKYLPIGKNNMFSLLRQELELTGEGKKTLGLIRIVR